MTEIKQPSSRQLLAERIAGGLIALDLGAGIVEQKIDLQGKPRSIRFYRHEVMDGTIWIYGPSFIKFSFQCSGIGSRNLVYGSESYAFAALRAIARCDREALQQVPVKDGSS
ncbi:MAG: hypothetical protein AAGF24_09055 [Cyanobacteria bacterium P01_H01_bin.121]